MLGFYVHVCAIYVRWSVFGGQSEGNQNQLYLIQLGEERKLGNRNERRREGKRWATLPPTVSDTVGFGYLQTPPMCFFLGCFPPPSRETCPGRRPQAPACFKSADAHGHIGPHGMRRCLRFSYRGTCRVPPTPPPRRQKSGPFWRVLDVHKTSQIPSKMALGRGQFGARGGSPKKLNTRRKLVL